MTIKAILMKMRSVYKMDVRLTKQELRSKILRKLSKQKEENRRIKSCLIKEKLFKKVKDSYDEILEMLYVNLLLYKENI